MMLAGVRGFESRMIQGISAPPSERGTEHLLDG